jgi:ribosomal protein L1
LTHLTSLRPSSVKGTFLRKVSISTTMSPGALITHEG